MGQHRSGRRRVWQTLPLTGSWNGKEFGGTFATGLIEEGHHVLPAVPNAAFSAEYAKDYDNGKHQKRFEKWMQNIYKPTFEYLSEHNLPFSTGHSNIAGGIKSRAKRQGQYIDGNSWPPEDPEDFPGLIDNGEMRMDNYLVSPLSPVELWEDHGRHLLGNGFTQQMADLYPDPPMILYLDNNEGGRASHHQFPDNSDRFKEKYGSDLSRAEVKDILAKEWKKRYDAMFDAAREAAGGQWGDSLRFVAYNAWPYFSKGGLLDEDESTLDDHAETGEWRFWDGAMPEVYNNDWQVYRGKTDYTLKSVQTGSTSNQVLQDRVFEEDPGYIYASIGWEGSYPQRRRSTTNYYATGANPLNGPPAVQRWDTDRYQGWLQFAMWAQRPRTFHEFRGGADPGNEYYRATYDAYLRSVDHVWGTEELHEFWRHGDLVENPNRPDFKGAKRWYILGSDANKSENKEGPGLRVFALALVVGDEPNRRWLVYSHAPLGARSGASITVPGYGDIEVDVSRTGSFHVVDESDGFVETVVEGRTAPDDVTGWDSSTALGAGEGPKVYDLPCDTLSEWSGEWGVDNDGNLMEYRMTPNMASAPDAPTFGVELVEDDERGTVFDVSGEDTGIWGQRGPQTNAAKAKNTTIEIGFKAKETSGVQVVFGNGGGGTKGYNLYLDGDTLYSGFAIKGGKSNFLELGTIEAGKWYDVTLMLKDATDSWTDGKYHAYINGSKVAAGPGQVQPDYHEAPLIGFKRWGKTHNGTRYRKEEKGGNFAGWISKFKMTNDARPP